MTTCPNEVLHGWLKEELRSILATLPPVAALADAVTLRSAWERWQEGLSVKPTLGAELPPLRILLVMDNLVGHKTPGVRVVVLLDEDHAAGHAAGRVVVEHGREPATHPQASGIGRSAAGQPRGDHQLVRGGDEALEPVADAIRLGRQASRSSSSATRAATLRRVRCLCLGGAETTADQLWQPS